MVDNALSTRASLDAKLEKIHQEMLTLVAPRATITCRCTPPPTPPCPRCLESISLVDAEGFPRFPDEICISLARLKGEAARTRADAVAAQARLDATLHETLAPTTETVDDSRPVVVVPPPLPFCLVAAVTPSSPAHQAGLLVGDVVVKVGSVIGTADASSAATLARVPDAVRLSLGAGKRCIVIVDRGDRREVLPVQPTAPGVASPLGAVLEPLKD